MSNVGGHYGPPGSKSPFPHQQSATSSDHREDLEPIDKNPDDLSLEEKMKMKQQALSAGITGGGGRQQKIGESHQMRKLDGDSQRLNRNKSKPSDQGDEAWETTSETSDTEGKGRKGFSKNKTDRKLNNRGPIGDKRMGYNTSQMNGRPGRPEDLKSEEMIGEKKRDKLDVDTTAFTNNGFQEVRNKKIVKDGLGSLNVGRSMKDDSKRGRGAKGVTKEKGPGGLGGGGPGGRVQGQSKPFSREWCNKPPRLQRMETLRKQQHHHEVSDMNKMNQNVSLFLSREVGCPPPAPPPSVNAWDKPITATLRTTPPPSTNSLQLGSSMNSSQDKTGIEMNDHGQSGTSSQTSSPSAEKALTKMAVEKSLLDGTTPPVQTIIFENTNYKAPPSEMAMKSRYNIGPKGQRLDKGRGKIEEELEDSHMGLGGFKAGELKPSDKIQESIQMSIAFNKNEDSADMKLDFPFDSDLTQLTDDKSNIPRSDFRLGQTSAADLDQKIASVKKVWDNPAGSMMEHQHHVDEGHGVVSTSSSFTPPFGSGVDTSLDPSAGHQVDDSAFTGDVYSSGPQIQGSNSYATSGPNMMKPDPSSASSGVCKVKQQPQPATVVLTPGMPPHSPPLYSQPGHINYQAQFPSGMPGIPSPPAALFGNQQVPNQGDLYHSYPLGSTQVLSSQGRSAFSQFQYNMSQGLNQTASYSQFHLQTAPPPSAPPLDAFNLYRSPAAPSSFTGSPQLSNNQSTVLISSSANSLMSATVKSSTQPIGTIGSKAAYQSTAPPPSAQVYLQYEPPPQLYPQNFMAGSQLVQQRATIQPSPSFYSNSGAQTAGLFQGSSMLGTSGHAPLNSASFGMQGFGTQSPAPAPTGNPNPVGVQNYTSQMGHVRGTSGGVYLKPSGGPNTQHPVDSAKSPSSNQEAMQSVFGQQIPSPKSRAAAAGGAKQPTPSAPQQPSPTQSHHKFPSYQPHTVSQSNLVMGGGAQGQGVVGGGGRGVIGGVRGGVGSGGPRYPQPPGPIQRPTYPPQQAMMRHPGPRGLQPSAQPRPGPPLNNKMANQYFQQPGNSVKLEGTNMEGKCESGGPDMKMGCESGSGGGKPGDAKVKEEGGNGGGQEQ